MIFSVSKVIMRVGEEDITAFSKLALRTNKIKVYLGKEKLENVPQYSHTLNFSLFSHLSKYLYFYTVSITQGCSAVALIQAPFTPILTPFSIQISVY